MTYSCLFRFILLVTVPKRSTDVLKTKKNRKDAPKSIGPPRCLTRQEVVLRCFKYVLVQIMPLVGLTAPKRFKDVAKTKGLLEKMEHSICKTTLTNIRPDWDSNLVLPGYKPQSIRIQPTGPPGTPITLGRRFPEVLKTTHIFGTSV